MKVRVLLYGHLRGLVGSSELSLEVPDGLTFGEFLKTLASRYRGFSDVISAQGEVRPLYIVFINGRDLELLGGYGYVVRDGDVVSLVPVSHGGSADAIERYLRELNSVRVDACYIDSSSVGEAVKQLDTVGENCVAQVIPEELYYGRGYVALAAYLAIRAFRLGLNISRRRSIEFLLYYFGDRQIGEVLTKLSSFKSSRYVVVLACVELGELGGGSGFVKDLLARCRVRPEEPLKPPLEALERMSAGVLKILS
jgi:molybdopterin converting factor small subunit